MASIFDLFRKIESGSVPLIKPVSWLIVGLGNHGPEYAGTRHNAGFYAVDALAKKMNIKIDRIKFHALTGEGVLAGEHLILMKPQTYMNRSGIAVSEAASFYKLDPGHILVYSDDVHLEPGRLRFRQKGSAGGQKGLNSIIEQLGTEAFPRIRLGVGERPDPGYDLADWVLGKLPPSDRELLDGRLNDLCSGTEALLEGDPDLAAQICNTGIRKTDEPEKGLEIQ
ncbi:MAG: aminoacyl-tRNA hydrolase [Clostridia bacterium]|nr:aminoacyl-tRNA hydrolase [Clostridia bacterium]